MTTHAWKTTSKNTAAALATQYSKRKLNHISQCLSFAAEYDSDEHPLGYKAALIELRHMVDVAAEIERS